MSVSDYSQIYQDAGQKYGVDPSLLMAQGQVESGGDPNIVSDAGATGIAQLMPSTAKSLGVTDRTDPKQSIDAQARLMAENINRYGDIPTALKAYHGGTDQSNWGPITSAYPAKVLKNYKGTQMAQNDTVQDTPLAAALKAYKDDPGSSPSVAQPSASNDTPLAAALKAYKDEPEASQSKPENQHNDLLTGYGKGAMEGLNNLTKLPTGALSMLAGAGTQINNKITDLYRAARGESTLTPQEESANVASAQAPINGVTNMIPTVNQLTGVGDIGAKVAATVINKLQGGNLTPEEIANEPTPSLSDAKTPLGKAIQSGAEALPGGALFRQGPLTTLGATGAANLISPDNPLGQLAAGTIGGGAGHFVEGKINPTPSSAPPPITSDDIRAASQPIYKKMETAGTVLSPVKNDEWLNKNSSILPKTPRGAGTEPTPVDDFVKEQESYRGKPLSIQEVVELDQRLNDKIQNEIRPNGTMTNAGRQFTQIQDNLREISRGAQPQDIVGGDPSGFKDWQDASGLWSSSLRLGDIERIKENSQYSPNPQTYIRNQLATIAKNPKKLNTYLPDEQTAIQNGAKTGAASNALNLIGSRLNPIIAGSVGGFGGAAAGYAASEGARSIAASLETKKLQNVQNAITNRPVVQKVLGNKSSISTPDYINFLKNAVIGIPGAVNASGISSPVNGQP